MANPDPPMPDIHLLSQSVLTAGTELAKFENLPSIAGGDRILTQLQELSYQVQQMRLETQQIRVETRQQFVRLE